MCFEDWLKPTLSLRADLTDSGENELAGQTEHTEGILVVPFIMTILSRKRNRR